MEDPVGQLEIDEKEEVVKEKEKHFENEFEVKKE